MGMKISTKQFFCIGKQKTNLFLVSIMKCRSGKKQVYAENRTNEQWNNTKHEKSNES